ncbi:MAG: branched-chain amino acid transport system permease protein [Acidimicrobiales bacterium]|jgi:branched-chain amino acid transport system permease protein
MSLFLQRLFDGLTLGAIYAVVAVALVLIFKATTLINFAQGELAMFGAFIAYILAVEQGLPIVLAIALAMVFSAALGAAIERVLIRPFDPTDHLPVVLITLGVFLILNAVAGEIWNYQPRAFPSLFPKGPDDYISVGGARLFYDGLGTWAMLGAMMGVLYVILNLTKTGLAFRAVSSNTDSARLVGIRTGRTLMFGWALACAFGTLGAALVAPRLFLQPNMMATLLIYAFAAAALGGLDSLPGAVMGGIIVGMIQSLLVGYLGDWDPLEWLRNLSLAVAFVVILIVLSFKPSGLFGTSRVERV